MGHACTLLGGTVSLNNVCKGWATGWQGKFVEPKEISLNFCFLHMLKGGH